MHLLLILACRSEPAASEASALVPLEGAALLRRVSLDLRGAPPTPDELDRYESDPDSLDALVDAWLASAAFEERWADVLGEQWMTTVDEFNVSVVEVRLDPSQEYAFLRGVGEEPLRLMARIAREDRPWSEIATADWTMANDTLLSIWDLEPIDPADTAAWRPARYQDQRPALGVMATNGLWWRYATTLNNLNRGRAAALSRLLLCYDFLERPVAFSGIGELTQEALLEATRTDAECLSCHSGLDPLASALFGFWWYETKDAGEMGRYHASREPLGAELLGLEPSYFGTAIRGVEELGELVATDPRFAACAVERTARALWRRDLVEKDYEALQEVQDAYEEDGRISSAIRALLRTGEYRAGALTEQASEALEEEIQTRRMLSVSQIESAVAALTGYTWTLEGWDQLDNDLLGYRVMAGGVDGETALTPSRFPTLTRTLVIRRLAQAAAQYVVQHDCAAAPEDRTLFSPDIADLGAVSAEDPAFGAELAWLHRRVLSSRADAEAIAEYRDLWTAVEQAAGPEQAWSSLVSVLLRDPSFWSY